MGLPIPEPLRFNQGYLCPVRYGRTFAYPLLVYGTLAAFHHFSAICIVQHLLGLAAGVLLLATWNRLRRFLPEAEVVRTLHTVLGLVALGVFLLSKGSLLMEHSIRPESVFPFFVILCIWLALCYRESLDGENFARAFCWGAALVYDAALIYFIKPNWGFGVLFAIAPVLISIVTIQKRVAFKTGIVLLPAALVYLTLYAPEQRLITLYDPRADCFLPSLLLSVHADMIRDEMARDAQDPSVLEGKRLLLGKMIGLIDDEISSAKGKYAAMSINPDVFLYGKDSVCALAERYFGQDKEAYKNFCFSYYERAWVHEPWPMSMKVLRQLLAFYSWKNQTYDASSRADMVFGKLAERTLPSLKDESALPAYQDYRREIAALERSTGKWKQAHVVSLVNTLLYVCYPIILFASLGLAAVVICRGRLEGRFGPLIPLAWITLYLHSYNFGNCLTIATVHTMQVGRYVKNQLVFLVFSECCAVLFIAAVSAIWWRGKRENELSDRSSDSVVAQTIKSASHGHSSE